MSNSGVLDVFGGADEMRRDIVDCGLTLLEREGLEAGRRQGGIEGVWIAWAFWLRHCRALPTFLELLSGFGDVLRAHGEAALRDDVVRFWGQWRSFVSAAVASGKQSRDVGPGVGADALHRELLSLACQLPSLSHLEPATDAIAWTAKAMLEAINARRVAPWSRAELDHRLRSLEREGPLGSELLGLSDLMALDYDANGWSALRAPM